MILRVGIKELPSERLIGFDAFYGFGSLTPNVIGTHEITSIFWRDGYAQIVVRGEAPRDLFDKLVIKLPDKDFVLASSAARAFSPTVHGDTCWAWGEPNPGAHGGDFEVEVS